MLYRAIIAKLGSDDGDYSVGQELIWGGFSSCSTNGEVVRERFLGDEDDYKTLFTIAVSAVHMMP